MLRFLVIIVVIYLALSRQGEKQLASARIVATIQLSQSCFLEKTLLVGKVEDCPANIVIFATRNFIFTNPEKIQRGFALQIVDTENYPSCYLEMFKVLEIVLNTTDGEKA